MRRRYSLVGFVVSFSYGIGGFACSSQSGAIDAEEVDSAEKWNKANNPAQVDSTFVYEVDQLPVSGGTRQAPIPGYYWATARDSVNWRWDGEDSLSPAEKFGKAFGIEGVDVAVSNDTGIRAQKERKECTSDAQCTGNDNSICAIPHGETKGRCLPEWWGICHGWSPYAFSQPAFKQPVTKNGVTFYAGDIEALMSLVYSSGLPKVQIGERCDRDADGSPVSRAFDAYGRVVGKECRDVNAGAFHVVISNLLGMRGQGLVYDRTYDDEVWNQPARDYTVKNAENGKLKEISKAEAIKLLGLEVGMYTVQATREYKRGEVEEGKYSATADGDIAFRLSGTGNADLYMKVGSPPTKDSYDCASTHAGSKEECKFTVKKGDKVYYLISGYSALSQAMLAVAIPKQGDIPYTYDREAARFFYVDLDFRYIREPMPNRLPADPDRYTYADHYTYILEVDADGRITGGEWVGDSRTKHPDFLWWPTGNPSGEVAGGKITFEKVLELSNAAAGVQPVSTETVTKLIDNASISSASAYATIGLKSGETLTVEMTGDGNADLYVRQGTKPTVSKFDCKSTRDTSTETCTVKAPDTGATYYVRARPVSKSTVTVVARVSK